MTTEATLVSFADVKSMVYDGDVHNEISLINQLSYLGGGTTLYMGNKLFGGMIIEWYGNICDFLCLLTIPLKSSDHLYLCCPHEHGPSPSSPFRPWRLAVPVKLNFWELCTWRLSQYLPAGWSWWSCDGRRWSWSVFGKNEETTQICSTAGIFIITCYSFQEFHAEFSLPIIWIELGTSAQSKIHKLRYPILSHGFATTHGPKNMESFEPPGSLHSRWHLFGDFRGLRGLWGPRASC